MAAEPDRDRRATAAPDGRRGADPLPRDGLRRRRPAASSLVLRRRAAEVLRATCPSRSPSLGTAHGFLYAVYLLAAFDLALRARGRRRAPCWSLLAGTVPFLSFSPSATSPREDPRRPARLTPPTPTPPPTSRRTCA